MNALTVGAMPEYGDIRLLAIAAGFGRCNIKQTLLRLPSAWLPLAPNVEFHITTKAPAVTVITSRGDIERGRSSYFSGARR
jgi:hypothetical protein